MKNQWKENQGYLLGNNLLRGECTRMMNSIIGRRRREPKEKKNKELKDNKSLREGMLKFGPKNRTNL